MTKSNVPIEERYYLRGALLKKGPTLVVASLLLILIVLLLVLLPQKSTVPWWTYLPLLVGWVVALVLLLRTKEFYYINQADKELQVAIVWSDKLQSVASLQTIYQATWLPHTKEVKLVTSRGSDFLKLRNGEQFIQALQDSYTRLYSSEENSLEVREDATEVSQKSSLKENEPSKNI